MTSSTPHNRLAAGATLVLVAVLSLFAAPAWAHDELTGATPAAGSHVEALPDQVELIFSGALLDEPGATEVTVTDAAGASLTAGDPVIDGTRLTQPLQGTASGTVTVIWRVVSSDGHPASDEFTFTVGAAPTTTATLAAEDPLTIGADITWMLWAGGAAVAIGGILLAVFLARKRRPRED
ncbi:MAG: copper resistance protein CopC [Microbacterium sp.]